MNYLDTIVKSIIILITLYSADYAYVNVITTDFKQQIIDINKNDVIKELFGPQILTYLILTFALYYFVINSNNTKEQKIFNGFLLGLCLYGVYEMINGTYIEKWKVNTITTHTLWGGVIFGLITFIVSSFSL